ncbi:MAG: hypothetical protein JWP29_883 [Rhodoferax sp.]|nr:hypothetical protein [Rhodoferax sp.]
MYLRRWVLLAVFVAGFHLAKTEVGDASMHWPNFELLQTIEKMLMQLGV